MNHMDYLSKLQNDYVYFKDMLKSLEKGKKTPGKGFAKMKCKEKIAELEKIFEENAKKRIGGSMVYVSKKKVNWELEE